jgi:hypothetical protein
VPTLRVKRLVKVPRLLYPTRYEMSVTLAADSSRWRLAMYSLIALRNRPGEIPVTSRNKRE